MYSVQYRVIDRKGNIVTRQLDRATEKALLKAADRVEQSNGFVEFTAWSYPKQEQRCEWFALCENPAVTTRAHTVLGEVPICERCNTKMDRL